MMSSQSKTVSEVMQSLGLEVPIGFHKDIDPEPYLDSKFALPVDKMEIGEIYEGISRSCNRAVWNGKFFEGTRNGKPYPLNHFTNFDGTDVFIPFIKND